MIDDKLHMNVMLLKYNALCGKALLINNNLLFIFRLFSQNEC